MIFMTGVLESNEGPSSMVDYYLQRESKEWGGCIDVTGYVQERDVIIKFICESQVLLQLVR